MDRMMYGTTMRRVMMPVMHRMMLYGMMLYGMMYLGVRKTTQTDEADK
jgi:hypothetical protein